MGKPCEVIHIELAANGFIISHGGTRGDTFSKREVARDPLELGMLVESWGSLLLPPTSSASQLRSTQASAAALGFGLVGGAENAARSTNKAPVPAANLHAYHDFGWALHRLKDNLRVARLGWNGKGMWLGLQVPDKHSKMSLPYIYMVTAQGDPVPWLASQADMLACDWHQVM